MSVPLPFRADQVGSMIRPDALMAAREQHQQGKLSDDGLREVEDREIRRAVKSRRMPASRS